MAKAEWGTKRICPSCGTRYYDMKQKTPTCPKCATPFDPEALLKSKRRNIPDEKPLPREDDDAVRLSDDLPLDSIEDGDEQPVIEDAAELGEDEDELEEVVEFDEDAEEEA